VPGLGSSGLIRSGGCSKGAQSGGWSLRNARRNLEGSRAPLQPPGIRSDRKGFDRSAVLSLFSLR
jgi:hypothetical protein